MKQLLLKSEFTKNSLTLVSGTILAQAIPLLLHPVLRRIYTPEDFGAMSVYLSIFSMITIVSALRYEATIVLPKNNNEAGNILSLTFILNILFSTILFFFIFFFKNEIAQFINFPEKHSIYLYFLPFACSLFGIYQSINYWLIRQKAFKASTTNKIIRRAVEGAVQGILGFLKVPGGLFIGDLLGNAANIIAGIRQIFRNKYQLRFVSPKKIAFVFKKYIDYPKFNAIPTLLSSAATILPFLFINKIYSTEIVGYLDLSRMVLSIPLIFIASTISQVFFQQITEKKHNSLSIKKDVMNIMYLLLTVICVEVLVILFLGPQIFGFVFGEKYTVSGSFSQILIFSFMLNFIGSTFSSVFLTFEKIRLNSIWQSAYFFAILSLLFFRNLEIYEFLLIYVAIEVIMHLINIMMIFFIVKNYENKLKQNFR
ncbi:MAG: lipopolysaccharide biosynthesis protein [Bacteroidetes bacterium]|nr:lipopolysaccharide biosynthesis protein [Bacteroidota bacterium]HET6244988.1 lipopolysaccharide biosynthesis protein [Bacteroidia bacterium]